MTLRPHERHRDGIDRRGGRRRRLAVSGPTGWVALGSIGNAQAAAAEPSVAVPTASGPVTGGVHGFPGTTTSVDLTARGYTENEYFISGTATSYRADGEWGADGRWPVTPDQTAPYTTRLLVRAPEDPEKFNGTVLVEWLNVSGNVDVDVDFGYMHEELTRGYAWVGVSAQQAGITSTGGSTLGANVVGLKAWDPERYGPLQHPGDEYSYDIFSQAGAAVRVGDGVDIVEGLDVQQVLATGQSQSAFRMLTYANAIQPRDDVYDGVLIHSRIGIGAPLGAGIGISLAATDGPRAADPGVPAPARVRDDLDVPVFQLLTETEIFDLAGGPGPTSFTAARQPDTDMLRTWEIAGTAHSDGYSLGILYPQYTEQFGNVTNLALLVPIVNNGPQHYVASAALRALKVWAAGGPAPARAMPIATTDDDIVRDAQGNAVGGVRTPLVDVPIATLTGETVKIPFSGATTPFDPITLATLYPTLDAYVTKFAKATASAVEAGFILPEDGPALIAAHTTLPGS